jgi:hypothetical protein
VCIASGTQGKLVGVETTEPVNVGDSTVTLNEVDGLVPGQYLTIAGGTVSYRIVKINRPIIDIASPRGEQPGVRVGAPIGAAIAFSPATFSPFGEVTNIGNSTSYDASKPLTALTLADRYVTVTQNGTTIRLPASLVDGQRHSIKCKADVTTTVDTAGGILIDGASTATVGPLENRTFRYSAAIGEWEIR